MIKSKFTFKKIIKEILIVIFTFVFVYFAFNNTYIRPILKVENYNNIINKNSSLVKEKNTQWHINKREHKIVMGLTGHTYLEMINENGEVMGQIHGFAYDPNTGEIIERAMKSGYKLKVFAFDYNYYLSRGKKEDVSGISLYSDVASNTISMWSKAKICAAAIDILDYNYPKYGFNFITETENSNSVSHSIINCIGLKDKNIGLITPGENTNLIKP